MAYLVIGALSFGVWQEWWLALGALSAMVCVVLSISRRASRLTTSRLSDLIPTLASR